LFGRDSNSLVFLPEVHIGSERLDAKGDRAGWSCSPRRGETYQPRAKPWVRDLVFSTKNRNRTIPPDLAKDLNAYLAGACRALGSEAYRVGGTEDHVHIACTLPRTLTVSKLLEGIKKTSSAWFKSKDSRCQGFAWQAGYGAFSLGQSQLASLVRYIDTQQQHHRSSSFQEELLMLLDRYGVEYDERYLWD